MNASNKNYAGLFGYTVLAEISNLVLDNVSLTLEGTPDIAASSSYGLLVGKSEVTEISNIEIKNTCSLSVTRDISYPIKIIFLFYRKYK